MENAYRRSLLYVPGDKPHMLEKGIFSVCDSMIIDWEDAVTLSQKELAREVTTNFLNQKSPKKEIFIRINDPASAQYTEDLKLAVTLPITGIVLPKACPESVKTVDRDFKKLGVLESLLLIPLIETAFGLIHLEATITASAHIKAVQFGAEDYTRDLEIARTKSSEEVLLARQIIGLVCRSQEVQAIDTPYVDFKDNAGLEQDICVAKQAGFKAKTAIHPAQLEIINHSFIPSEAEIAFAQRVVEISQLPENSHLGAFSLDGKMVDAPIIARAKRVLDRIQQYRSN
ncbi:CoA ester lyase [Anaerotruncus sp. AF02-27]|uniref:HpcH/HpaI aldolase/citrate lyase family protein n=1 Tax=Anaerotruncus TaxID=244127 RepID=UPI000E4CE973|nr:MULTISPECIES: CoA ester lyase [Anaerotruncus]RGX55944.1 CoA ester lyase [Anaerotruncus sp. AF02-27]